MEILIGLGVFVLLCGAAAIILWLRVLVVGLKRKLKEAEDGVGLLRRELEESCLRADQAEANARQRFDEALLRAGEESKRQEKVIRADAVQRSTAVVKGKVAEHLVPFREDFDFNPRDCRFLGSPIDFVIFDGLTEGSLARIVFIEVKAGRTKSLSGRERQVRDVVREGSVSWELLHVGAEAAAEVSRRLEGWEDAGG